MNVKCPLPPKLSSQWDNGSIGNSNSSDYKTLLSTTWTNALRDPRCLGHTSCLWMRNSDEICNLSGQIPYVQFLRKLVIFQKAVLRWFKDTSFLPMWRPAHLWIWIYKHRPQMHLLLTGSDSRGEPAALKALQGIWGTSVRKRNKPILSHTCFTWFWCECLAGSPLLLIPSPTKRTKRPSSPGPYSMTTKNCPETSLD